MLTFPDARVRFFGTCFLVAKINIMVNKAGRPFLFPEEMAQILSHRIRDGILKIGENFPTEKQLSDWFCVSISVAEEAISILKFRGLVESEKEKEVASDMLERPLPSLLKEQPDDFTNKTYLQSLFEFRMYIEPSAAELAAVNRSDEHITCLRKALSLMDVEIKSGRPDSELSIIAGIDFHNTIASATKNYYFYKLIRSMNDNLRLAIEAERNGSAKVKGAPEKVFKEYCLIYKSLVNKNISLAHNTMRQNILNSAARLDFIIGTESDNCYSKVTDGIV